MKRFSEVNPTKCFGFLFLVVLFLLPVFVFGTKSYYLRIAVLVLMFAGMSNGWNLISGYGNQVSLGHAAFFGLGAYTSTLLLKYIGLSPWLGMIAAGLVSGLSSLLVGIPTFRLRGHYYALATLAFAEVLRVLALYFRHFTGGAVGLTVPYLGDSFWFFQFYGNRTYYLVGLFMLFMTLLITYRIDRGRLGYQLRALKNSHEAAEVVGVDTYRAKLKANFLSALITGMYGTFYAQFQFFIDADTVLGFWTISVKMALMTILGGMGNIWGPLIGAGILVPLDEWTNAVFTGNLAAVSRLIYGGLLIALILWQPRGLLYWIYQSVARVWQRSRGIEKIGGNG
jgi:branched-chain amino acid transport system permease protein